MRRMIVAACAAALASCQSGPAAAAQDAIVVEPDWAAVALAESTGELSAAATLAAAAPDAKLAGWRAQAAQSNIPVLLPAQPSTGARFAAGGDASLMTFEHSYAFNATGADRNYLSIVGMCARRPESASAAERLARARAETQKPRLATLNARYQFTRSELGYELVFTKFGCAYELTLVCAGSCDPEAELVAIANSLAVINSR